MIFVIAAFILIIVYVVGVYNSLQTIKTRIKASVQEIGNQLKRQAELIPNLVESAKGYLKHEKAIFDKLTEARKVIDQAASSGDVSQIEAAQNLIQEALGGLRVVVESNPQIKGAEVVSKLMSELRDTADKVMYARRTLIDLTADFNQKLVTFPSNLVAKIFGFQQEKGLEMPTGGEYLRVSKEETKTPGVKLN